MKNRTIILSEEQLNELVSLGYGNSSEDDFAPYWGTQTFTTGAIDDGDFGLPDITDLIANDDGIDDRDSILGGNSSIARGLTLRETNKDLQKGKVDFSDDEKKILMSCPDDSVAKNAALNGFDEKLLAPTISDFRSAEEKAKNGDDETLENMGGKKAFDIFYRKYLELIRFSGQKRKANDDTDKLGSLKKDATKKKKVTKEGDVISFW